MQICFLKDEEYVIYKESFNNIQSCKVHEDLPHSNINPFLNNTISDTLMGCVDIVERYNTWNSRMNLVYLKRRVIASAHRSVK
jgi:hypothetical protein